MGATKLGVIGYGVMGGRLLRAATGHSSDPMTVAVAWDPSPAAMGRLQADLPGLPRPTDATRA